MNRGTPPGRTRAASTISIVRMVASRSKPEGVQGTSSRSEMALAAPSERSLGAVSMTTGHDRLLAENEFRDRKFENSRISLAAGGTLRIAVNESDVTTARLEFGSHTNRQDRFADAALALGDGNDPSHLPLRPDVCHGALVVKGRGLRCVSASYC
jgi:hypothetical protein